MVDIKQGNNECSIRFCVSKVIQDIPSLLKEILEEHNICHFEITETIRQNDIKITIIIFGKIENIDRIIDSIENECFLDEEFENTFSIKGYVSKPNRREGERQKGKPKSISETMEV